MNSNLAFIGTHANEDVASWQVECLLKMIMQKLTDEQTDKALEMVAGLTHDRQRKLISNLSQLGPTLHYGTYNNCGDAFIQLLERLTTGSHPSFTVAYLKGFHGSE